MSVPISIPKREIGIVGTTLYVAESNTIFPDLNSINSYVLLPSYLAKYSFCMFRDFPSLLEIEKCETHSFGYNN